MQSNSPPEPKCMAAVTQIPERRSDAHGQHTPGRSRMRQSNQGYNVVDSNPLFLVGPEMYVCTCA
jgi:hypothetical protein